MARRSTTRIAILTTLALVAGASLPGAASAQSGAVDPSASPLVSPVASPAAPPDALVVTSDDGLLTVTVPLELVPPGVELSATALAADQLPPELGEPADAAVGYRLAPDGTTFDGPVTVTRTVDLEAFGIDPATDGVPVLLLGSRSSDGTWEWLEDQQLTFETTTLTVSGTTTHFSDVVGFSQNFNIGLSYVAYTETVGDDFSWELTLRGPALEGGRAARPRILSVESSVIGDIATAGEVTQRPAKVVQDFTCTAPGTGWVQASKRVGNLGRGALTQELDLPTAVEQSIILRAALECAPEAYEVATFCLTVIHEAMGDYLSQLYGQMLLEALFAGAPAVTKVAITIKGANNDKPLVIDVTDLSAPIEGTLGLSNAGKKQLQSVVLTYENGATLDVTGKVREIIGGRTFEVRFPQEDTFGTGCEK